MSIKKYVKKDLEKSSEQFEKYVIPEMRKLGFDGKIIIVEGINQEIADILDISAGIDVLYVDNNGIKGVGSRIQNCNFSYNTFTIRYERESGKETEYSKRKNAIENNYMYPYYTIQAYISEDKELISLGIAKTSEILEFIDKGYADIKETGMDKIGQAKFFTIKWKTFKEKGYTLLEFKK